MQGTIVKIVAADGQQVSAGDTIVVLEAMKMEQPLTAHKAGTVSGLSVEVGQTVSAGAVICELATRRLTGSATAGVMMARLPGDPGVGRLAAVRGRLPAAQQRTATGSGTSSPTRAGAAARCCGTWP